jgi:hypothetical protein
VEARERCSDATETSYAKCGSHCDGSGGLNGVRIQVDAERVRQSQAMRVCVSD